MSARLRLRTSTVVLQRWSGCPVSGFANHSNRRGYRIRRDDFAAARANPSFRISNKSSRCLTLSALASFRYSCHTERLFSWPSNVYLWTTHRSFAASQTGGISAITDAACLRRKYRIKRTHEIALYATPLLTRLGRSLRLRNPPYNRSWDACGLTPAVLRIISWALWKVGLRGSTVFSNNG